MSKPKSGRIDRLIDRVAKPAGIPVVRVSNGDIRKDSLSEDYTTVLPLFLSNSRGEEAGILSRQCTQNYKLVPIYRFVRKLLGAPTVSFRCTRCEGVGARVPPSARFRDRSELGECSVCRGTGVQSRVGRVRNPDAVADMAIGFSVDEMIRVAPSRRRYVENTYPLLDLGWTREDARNYLAARGFADTPRSACIGCPFHSQSEWLRLRRESPREWHDAVAFDAAIRKVPGSSGIESEAFLHRQRVPLPLVTLASDTGESASGCSPFGCRSSAGVSARAEEAMLDGDEGGLEAS